MGCTNAAWQQQGYKCVANRAAALPRARSCSLIRHERLLLLDRLLHLLVLPLAQLEPHHLRCSRRRQRGVCRTRLATERARTRTRTHPKHRTARHHARTCSEGGASPSGDHGADHDSRLALSLVMIFMDLAMLAMYSTRPCAHAQQRAGPLKAGGGVRQRVTAGQSHGSHGSARARAHAHAPPLW